MRLFLITLALVLATASVQADIVFSEVMYDLPGADEGLEWVELANAGVGSVNLSGWKLYEASVNHGLTLVNGSMVLDGGEYAVIADNSVDFLAAHQSFNATLFDSSWGSLSNTGETLVLKNTSGGIVANLTYNASWGAAGNNKSLEKKNLTAGDDSGNWGEGAMDAGTPGLENTINAVGETTSSTTSTSSTTTSSTISTSTSSTSTTSTTSSTTTSSPSTTSVLQATSSLGQTSTSSTSTSSTTSSSSSSTTSVSTTTLVLVTTVDNRGTVVPTTLPEATTTVRETAAFAGEIVISEVMYNPSTSQGPDSENEYIELHNTGNRSVDFSNWTLSDNDGRETLVGYDGGATVVSAGGYAIITDEDTRISVPAGVLHLTTGDKTICGRGLSNNGETLTLKDAYGNTIDWVSYVKSDGGNGNGRSLEKTERGWRESEVGGSPGKTNTATVKRDRHRCVDGTMWSSCSSSRPYYCRHGNLENKCRKCGCPTGLACLDDGGCGVAGEKTTTSVKPTRAVSAALVETTSLRETTTLKVEPTPAARVSPTTVTLKPPAARQAPPTGMFVSGKQKTGRGGKTLIVVVIALTAGLLARSNETRKRAYGKIE